jgi:hypothetical protein
MKAELECLAGFAPRRRSRGRAGTGADQLLGQIDQQRNVQSSVGKSIRTLDINSEFNLQKNANARAACGSPAAGTDLRSERAGMSQSPQWLSSYGDDPNGWRMGGAASAKDCTRTLPESMHRPHSRLNGLWQCDMLNLVVV